MGVERVDYSSDEEYQQALQQEEAWAEQQAYEAHQAQLEAEQEQAEVEVQIRADAEAAQAEADAKAEAEQIPF